MFFACERNWCVADVSSVTQLALRRSRMRDCGEISV